MASETEAVGTFQHSKLGNLREEKALERSIDIEFRGGFMLKQWKALQTEKNLERDAHLARHRQLRLLESICPY